MGGRGRALLCWAALCSSLAAAVPAPAPALSREGEDCRTPRGEAGTCRNINACPSLLALVAQRPSQVSGASNLGPSEWGARERFCPVCL
ncbi:Protein of unknown function [Gryllus bimaculatus]|nr:Protein of unknown function [Gryllus bimaculatus]